MHNDKDLKVEIFLEIKFLPLIFVSEKFIKHKDMTERQPDVNPTLRYELREVAEALSVRKATILSWTRRGLMTSEIRPFNGRKVWTGKEIIRVWRLYA